MLGAGRGRNATFPSRRVQRDWIAFMSFGGAFLDACNGGSESYCSINDSVRGCDFWDQEGMVFEPVSAMRTQMHQ